MTDNIFDRLAELLASSGPVNWELATELGASVAGEPGTVPAGAQDYWLGLVDTVQRMLAQHTPLDFPSVPTAVLDRRDWTAATIPEFDYLAEPLAAKLSAGQAAGPFGPIFSIMVGLQIGSMVGSMSHRALASFDAALPPLAGSHHRFIVPNIEEFVSSHGLETDQARFWVVAHEVVQTRLLAEPLLSARLRSLISTYVDGLELDPEAMSMGGGEAGFDPEQIGQMMQDPSFLTGMFSGPHQDEDLAEIQAFVAVIEGYTGFLLNHLEHNFIPELPRIREAVDRRRAEPSPGETFLQKMLGLELGRPQAGTSFFEEIERRWGSEAPTTVWKGENGLPTSAELADPVAWAARTLLS